MVSARRAPLARRAASAVILALLFTLYVWWRGSGVDLAPAAIVGLLAVVGLLMFAMFWLIRPPEPAEQAAPTVPAGVIEADRPPRPFREMPGHQKRSLLLVSLCAVLLCLLLVPPMPVVASRHEWGALSFAVLVAGAALLGTWWMWHRARFPSKRTLAFEQRVAEKGKWRMAGVRLGGYVGAIAMFAASGATYQALDPPEWAAILGALGVNLLGAFAFLSFEEWQARRSDST